MLPLRISPKARGFLGPDGEPFFWLADTQWELFRYHTLAEARQILEMRRNQGFTVFQVMMTGVGDGTVPNREGEPPWQGGAPATPNERYFAHADAIIDAARDAGMILVIGVYHQLQRERLIPENVRAYARWLAERHKDTPHIVWSMYPQAKVEYLPVLRELAAGLREGDAGSHLITVHPDPSPTSSSFIHDQSWLDFNSVQTCVDYERIVPMVTADYRRIPIKPVVMAEGGYEGLQFGKLQRALEIRKQAYWTHLAGAHHTYGHNGCWEAPDEWQSWIDAPGAHSLTIYRRVVTSFPEWWNAIPDQTIFLSDTGTGLNINTAMRSANGDWALAYLASSAPVSLRIDSLTAERVTASWIDPTTGEETLIGQFPSSGARDFTLPIGWQDALLALRG